MKVTDFILTVFCPILFFSIGVNSVDRHNFKTCEQSNFCKRCRSMNKSQNSMFHLVSDSIILNDKYLEAIIANTNYENVFLRMRLDGLKDKTLRVRINENGNPMYNRFQPVHALVSEPIFQSMTMARNETTIELELEQSTIKVFINIIPFKLNVYVHDELIIGINHNNLMQFEHYRPKPETIPDNEVGSWEEFFKEHQDSKPRGPSAVSMDFTLYSSTHLYGLPEHADSFYLKETSGSDPYRFYNLDVFEYELYNTMALYGAVPFLMGHGKKNSVGLFWLNAAETWVDIAGVNNNVDHTSVVESIVNLVSGSSGEKEVPQAHFMSESGIIDFFIMLGPKPMDVTRQYSLLTGTAPLPPIFSLAYHQCRWNYNDQKDVHNVETNFDVYDIPMDVMWLDIEHTDSKKYFTWDPIKFSNPIEMIRNLTNKGRKLVTIVDPHIKRDSNYFLHNDALNNDLYVKNKDGNVYEGWCWPGSSSYLDFLNPKVQEYYVSRFSFNNYVGSNEDLYIWNDMNEPSVFNGPEVTMPKDCIHYGNYEHRDIHNIYGLMQVMSTYEGLIKRSKGNKRPFILTRSHFAGTQRFAAVWTGDNIAEWSHLKISIPMCLSLAISGISFCGADVGGFFNNPDKELFIRWYQTGTYLPFFRGHSHIDTKRREPWLFDEQTTSLVRETIRTRYSLLPLWYTLFRNHELTGAPVIRPLFFEFPFEDNVNNIDNQFMIGNSLLVCPVTEPNVQEISIYFPGKDEVWYDKDNFQPIKINGFVKIPVPINKIPVYQRGGTIIPIKQRVRRSSSLMKDDPYTLMVGIDLKGTAKGSLYIDDEDSFEYRDGKFIHLEYEFINNQLISKCIHCITLTTNSWLEKVMIIGIPSVFSKASIHSKEGSTTELTVLYSASNQVLTIRKPSINIAQNWTIILL
ncbi:neutral alpha-glucosidase C [Daktulosphaira vitifoliae]|uniref:neutral alpha-glucosidase C n=1 Tax=Daktulosphaira vitifoliae TaxID=58002 RepID=UPI0021A9B9EE|nr:neutral alpha-glucosidase C [Daktulosphaira vitifoliae]